MSERNYSQVIKVVDPQVDFWPLPETSVDPVAVVAAFYAEEVKNRKQEEIRKCAQNWCLK